MPSTRTNTGDKSLITSICYYTPKNFLLFFSKSSAVRIFLLASKGLPRPIIPYLCLLENDNLELFLFSIQERSSFTSILTNFSIGIPMTRSIFIFVFFDIVYIFLPRVKYSYMRSTRYLSSLNLLIKVYNIMTYLSIYFFTKNLKILPIIVYSLKEYMLPIFGICICKCKIFYKIEPFQSHELQ